MVMFVLVNLDDDCDGDSYVVEIVVEDVVCTVVAVVSYSV